MIIKIKKLEELKGFDPDHFLADPAANGLSGTFSDILARTAAEMAKDTEGICVAIVRDIGRNEEFAISTPCVDGLAQRFVFFNTVVCDPLDGEIRAIVLDPANPDNYLFDECLMNEQGSYF